MCSWVNIPTRSTGRMYFTTIHASVLYTLQYYARFTTIHASVLCTLPIFSSLHSFSDRNRQSQGPVCLVSSPRRKCNRGACRQSKYVLSCCINNYITFSPPQIAYELIEAAGAENILQVQGLPKEDTTIQ